MGDVTDDPFCAGVKADTIDFGSGESKGIDFKKLNTPEARAASEKWRKEVEQRLTAKEASQKRMAEYLKRNVDEGEIDNDWECEFIDSVYRKTHSALPYLSDKQDSILTRLFEKY